MGKEEFKAVLEGMINDADQAEKAAGGDFGDLTEDQLTGAERALLSAAGGELDDDVAGFADSFLKLGDIDGESKYTEVEWTYDAGPKLRNAFEYIKIKFPT